MESTIEKKKKKKKGKKIVVGNSLRLNNTANNQVIDNKAFHKGDYTIPRKPKNPASNSNTSKQKKKTINNTNNNHARANTNTNTSRQFVKKKTGHVLARLHKDVAIGKVRAALKSESELPDRFKNAFKGRSLEVNESREFVILKGEYVPYPVKKMLEKNNLKGWLEWLQGLQGWIIDTDKSHFVEKFRDLHEVYDVKVRMLMKEVTTEKTKSLLRLLKYKDPLTLKEGGNGTKQSTTQETLWKKPKETDSLDAAVGMIRPFLEVIKYFCTDPRDKWTSLPWLVLTPGQCRSRIDRITNLVKTLMRNSEWGPDVPVVSINRHCRSSSFILLLFSNFHHVILPSYSQHWAAHPPRNSYPLAVITPEIMTELVVGVANILSLLFFEESNIMKNLKDVDCLLTASMKGPPKRYGRNSKKTNPSRNCKTKTTREGPSVDDVVIDLTGLSIND